MEFIQETPTKRQKIDDGRSTRGKGYDSADDSGDNLFDEYETIDTVPLPGLLRNHQPSSSLVPLSPSHHNTQPTQILNGAGPTSQSGRNPSVVQVAASSPLAKPVVQSPSPILQKLGGSLANSMAPPGTAFRSPIAIHRPGPTVDLSSDDDDRPVYRGALSDDESQTSRKADIKPSNFTNSRQNGLDYANTNRFNEITSQAWYKPCEKTRPSQSFLPSLSSSGADSRRRQASNGSATPVKRSADVMADAYGSASRPAKAHQALPVKVQQQQDITLDDIPDYQIRTKVDRMHKILPTQTIAACKAALLKRKGNFDDAMDYLATLDDDQPTIDLTLSDNDRQPFNSAKPTAKQQLKAPAKSIQSKWTATQAFSQHPPPSSSPPPNVNGPKPRKRLVQGRKNLPLPRSIIPCKPSPALHRSPDPTDADTLSDSAIGSVSGTDDDETERKVFSFLNSCTSNQLSDIAAVSETVASFVLSKKPFKNLGAIRKISSDNKPNPKRTAKRPIGDKIVDTCLEMWKCYDAIDGLVRQCESAGRPVAEQIKKWGVDVYGATNDGELDLTNFDQKSEAETSIRDSGIGTPTSGVASADEDGEIKGAAKDRNFVFGQPRLLQEDVVLKDYQVVGVNWLALLFENKLSCILADDMGLGKTCQVIAFLAHLFEIGNKGPHLVIVPGSTIENWLREFSVFCPKLAVMPYYGT